MWIVFLYYNFDYIFFNKIWNLNIVLKQMTWFGGLFRKKNKENSEIENDFDLDLDVMVNNVVN